MDYFSPTVAALAIIISAYFGLRGVQSAKKAEEQRQATDREIARAAQQATNDNASGQLALGIAKDLRADVTELREQLDETRDKLEEAETTARALQREVTQMQSLLDAANEQSDLLGKQLEAAEEANTLLRRRERILAEHGRILGQWAQNYYDAGHPPGMVPPPILMDL